MVQDYVRDTDDGFRLCTGKLAKPVQVYSVDRPVERETFESNYGGQDNRMYLWYTLPMYEAASVLCNGIQNDKAKFNDTVSIAAHFAYKSPEGNNATLLLCEVALDEKLTMCEEWPVYKEPGGEVRDIPDEEVVFYMGWFNRVSERRNGVLVPTARVQINPRGYRTRSNYYPDYYVRKLDRIKIKYLVILNGYTEEPNNWASATESVNDDILSQ